MSNHNAKYYLSKALTVINWIKKGKNEELLECGKLGGKCSEIVAAQVETLNEVQHIISTPDILHSFFSMAVRGDNPSQRIPDLFKQLEQEQESSVIDMKDTLKYLRLLATELEEDAEDDEQSIPYCNAVVKAIKVLELTNKFFSKKG